MLKILQARLQRYMSQELPDVQTGFRKGRGTRDQIASIHWVIGKASLTTLKPLCGSQQTQKFFKRWGYQTTLPAS